MAQFDTEYELVWDAVPVKDVGTYTLTPRGGTALLDGLGKTLGHVDTVVGYHEDDIVIVAVITDGAEENSSREWKLEDVRSCKCREADRGWLALHLLGRCGHRPHSQPVVHWALRHRVS